jgi:hypothetical protein
MHRAADGEVLAQHRTVVEVLPELPRLGQPVRGRREVTERHVGAGDVVQGERELLARTEVASDRE